MTSSDIFHPPADQLFRAFVGGAFVLALFLAALWLNWGPSPTLATGAVLTLLIGLLSLHVAILRRVQDKTRRLEESEALLNSFFANTPAAFIIYDDESHYVRVNKYAAEWYGKPEQDIVGKSVHEILSTDLAKVTAARNRQVLHREHSLTVDTFSTTFPLNSPEAKTTHWQGVRFPVPLSRNRIGVAVVNLNVTEQVKAQASLRKSVQAQRDADARLKTVLEQMPSGVTIRDASSREDVIFNNEARRILGLPMRTLEAASDYGAVHQDGSPLLSEEWPLARALATGRPIQDEEILLRGDDGKQVTLRCRAAPVRDPDGHIIAGVAVFDDVTRQKQREAEIRNLYHDLEERSAQVEAERARWQGVVEGIADEVWVCDADGVMSLINLPDVTQMGLEEFQGKTVQQVYEQVDILSLDGRMRPFEQAPLFRALATGGPVRGEEIMRHKQTGRERYRHYSAAPTRDARGTITGAVAIVRDITEQKHMQEALRQSEEQLRAAAQAANIGMWNWDPRSSVVRVSANWRQVFGLPADAPVTFETWRNALHPDDCDASVNALLRATETKTEYNVEYRIVWPDGTVRWIVDRGRGTYDENGQAVNVAGINVDITERRLAEAALRDTLNQLRLNEERFRTALKHAPITVYNQDCNLHYTWAFNPWGSQSTDLVGEHAALLAPQYNRQLDSIKRRVLETGIGSRREVNAMGRDLREHVYDLTIDPLRDQSGGIVGITCAAIDVTEYKRTAEHIRELNRQLEQRAADLEIANKELESFSYSISHDLRTPLATIDGFARVLKDDYSAALPPDGQRYLEFIRSGTHQMNELITSLLSLARLTRHPLKKQTVNMRELVMQAMQAIEPQPERTDLTVEVQELVDAEADPVLLRQVWVNLISNAFKFTGGSERPEVVIGSWVVENGDWKLKGASGMDTAGAVPASTQPPTSTVQSPISDLQPPTPNPQSPIYYIRDNGAGFDNSQVDRLFGVFQRLHDQDEYEGTGVGLAIVQRIIHRHGGRVWAHGEQGRGATFYFTLA